MSFFFSSAVAQTALDLHHINTVTPWELKHKLVALNILTSDENSKELDNALELSKNDERVIQELAASLVRAGRNIQLGCKSPFPGDRSGRHVPHFLFFLPADLQTGCTSAGRSKARSAAAKGDGEGDRARRGQGYGGAR